jgi:hypothetical protein
VGGVSRFQGKPDLNNFAPRVGVAWRVTPKTVVRSGAGMFYSSHTGIGNAPTVFGVTGFLSSATSPPSRWRHPDRHTQQSVPQRRQQSERQFARANFRTGVAFYDRSNRVPYSWQWNFDVQRELPRNALFEIGYVGTHALKLPQDRSLNQLPDSALALGDGLRQLVPNPFYGQIAIGPLASQTVARALLMRPYPQFQDVTSSANSWGSSNYNALQVKVEKRYAKGSRLGSYTYSKAMDTSPACSTASVGATTGSGVGGVRTGTT